MFLSLVDNLREMLRVHLATVQFYVWVTVAGLFVARLLRISRS